MAPGRLLCTLESAYRANPRCKWLQHAAAPAQGVLSNRVYVARTGEAHPEAVSCTHHTTGAENRLLVLPYYGRWKLTFGLAIEWRSTSRLPARDLCRTLVVAVF
jgi:hypothetical protein